MAEPLKNMYNVAFFESICPVLKRNIPAFDCSYFIHRVFNNEWPDLELKQRVDHIATALRYFLPENFDDAAQIVVNITNDIMRSGAQSQGFALIFLPEFIMKFGLNNVDTSLQTLKKITKLVSAEFAIRPFLINHQSQVMALLKECSIDDDPNVRRFASEGCRPRLPWGLGIPQLKQDPGPILEILETLKNDPSEYVRRSVANNLNDIAKDHPRLVVELMNRWRGSSAETDWIIKHGSRTLLKKANGSAMKLHGFSEKINASINSLKLSSSRISIGDSLAFAFHLENKDRKTTLIRLDYGIDYLTSTGKTSTKIFKILENRFEPGKKVLIQRKQSFKNFTTRKHFKGKHRIFILANGKKLVHKDFVVE